MPPTRRPVSEAVFNELRAEILSGRLAAGAALAPERTLSETFAVNRHAVREAVKRLQQAGLVEVHHGGSTRVRDWRATGGLDLLAQLPLVGEAGGGPDVLRAVVEARRCIGVDIARLAALRASPEAIAELRARVGGGGSLDAAAIRYEELWRVLVRACDNVAYELAYNSLMATTDAALPASRAVFADEVRATDAHRELVEAVAGGDGELAAQRAGALLSRSLVSVLEPADA
ncbi:MAG TPA: GntR family transcriptional regulator [Solirubrobacteraceae bacterium]|nr:GntR family transcriptional regulator [Solirubrobacteraceae bacterium]